MFLFLRWLYKHLLEIGVFQTIHQFILRITPDWFDRAVCIEGAGAIVANAFVQLDGTVDRFNDFKQCNVPRLSRKGYTAARTARGMQQPSDGKLGDDLRQK